MVDKIRSLWDKTENLFKIGTLSKANGTDGNLQEVQLKTLRNIEDAVKLGQFGFNSKAPAGTRCIVAQIGNNAIVIANEHIASIIDITSGDTVVYNSTGTYIKLVGNDIEMNAENVNIISTTLTHNGTNIGDTHVHAQSTDSGGDTQQNTNPPQ